MRPSTHLARLPTLIRGLLHQPVGRALIATAVLWLYGFIVCKHLYWRDPHSAFFSSDHVYDLDYSLHRQHEADAFLQSSVQDNVRLLKNEGTIEYCAAFVTVKRDKIQYVDEAVGSLLQGLFPEERKKMWVDVFFADTQTDKHPTWEQPWLRKAADRAYGYNVSAELMGNLTDWERERNFYRKGVFDYLYALKACYDTGASYVIMFEDDIILAEGWMAKTSQALRQIDARSKQRGDRFWNWIYLRLFYTETSMSWEDTDFWYRNMWLAFTLASLTGFALLRTARNFAPSSRRYLDNWTIAAICLVTIPAFTTLLYMIGKYSLFPPSTVFVLNKHGCCTQALLFPRPEIPDLIKYLEERGHGQTDSMIEDYADLTDKQRLAMGKQQVQHVGLQSSRDNTFINSQSTWAFWFETYDAKKLRREHEQLMRES